MHAFRLNHVRKSFRGSHGEVREIFRDLSLDVESGRTLSVVGPSGCGKTTLLNILAALEPIGGGSIAGPGGLRRAPTPIGYLFQRDALLPWRTAIDNALLGLECRGLVDRKARVRADEHFERFGLASFEQAWPHTLSGGQRQRVALIQNLLLDPDILLLDEPFGSLDFQTKLVLEEELLDVIRSGPPKTVVLVTHDIEEAITVGDRVIVLGPAPRGIIMDEAIHFPDGERSPVEARQSQQVRDLFGRIWQNLRAPAATESTAPRDVDSGPTL